MPTIKQYADALTDSKGMVATAARALGVSRRSVYDAIQKHPKVAEAREEARDYAVDVGENELFKAVKNGEGWAVSLLLKTLGKSRGYVEKQEIDATVRGDIVINLLDLPEPK